MKIQKTFAVEFEGATFVFRKPTAKDLLGFTTDKKDTIQIAFSGLVSVHGLTDENGAEFTVEEVRTLELPADAVFHIMKMWNEKLAELMPGGAKTPEKKDSTTT